jgi:allophanate hydrolase
MITVDGLLADYRAQRLAPADVIAGIFDRIGTSLSPVWIALADPREAVVRARAVDLSLPLAGVPFAIKDNIDARGLATTAGCPSFAYEPDRSATVVHRLMNAGAILIGKTNMDQFATGLVGTRSPYGACSSVFDERYISGGSSSGSAVAVASGLCAFSLGTDTAGSGRVPAAFNALVGLKPTRGLLSAAGVVPACRSLDCVSIFTRTATDARAVWAVARGTDACDPFSRAYAPAASPWLDGEFTFGVPDAAQLQFFGDAEAQRSFEAAAARLSAAGGRRVTIDYTPFKEAASLLYAGPWVAERFAAVGEFLSTNPDDAHPVVRDIVLRGRNYSAADAYRAAYRLAALTKDAEAQWARMDVMLLPTAGTIYTKAAVDADPVALNTNLGYYTNFVNLMDLAAVAVPAGMRADGLPFGVSLIGRACADEALLSLAHRFLGEEEARPESASGSVQVAVVGAHLTGQPLNWQLTERGARLVKSCRTAPGYRLFALPDTTPPKPGLLWEPGFDGHGIEIEVWSVPEERFGSFVAAVPPPLAIGTLRLDSGELVKGFVCEPRALDGATEITQFSSWRAYLAHVAQT